MTVQLCINRKQLRRCVRLPFSCQFLRKLEHVVTVKGAQHANHVVGG